MRNASWGIVFGAAILLAGCDNNGSLEDLVQYVDQVKSRRGIKIEPLPEMKVQEVYIPQHFGSGETDPFMRLERRPQAIRREVRERLASRHQVRQAPEERDGLDAPFENLLQLESQVRQELLTQLEVLIDVRDREITDISAFIRKCGPGWEDGITKLEELSNVELGQGLLDKDIETDEDNSTLSLATAEEMILSLMQRIEVRDDHLKELRIHAARCRVGAEATYK